MILGILKVVAKGAPPAARTSTNSIRRPKACGLLSVFTFVLLLKVTCVAADEVWVFVPPGASTAERLAAGDLVGFLRKIYSSDQFTITNRLPASGTGIVLGCATNPAVRSLLLTQPPSTPESFLVSAQHKGDLQIGIIAGADARGVAYGVYAILEKLGCGFYLSYDALPPRSKDSFSLNEWHAADESRVKDRLVFDWHNFLSGCSTWNLADWQSWIRQSQKMRFNTIMVHAYGNNPMVSYSFNGKTKPVGYLSTTVKGRDWSTMHVNDVRRLWGGEVFDQPAFGAAAALVADAHRVAAAQALMRDVFQYARQREMDVYFANDIDTVTANPQELILTLPEEARFSTGTNKFWLANPDTPEGYSFYKAQVQSLLEPYTNLTSLVLWFRVGLTPWMEMKLEEMPASWQSQYNQQIAETPEAGKFWRAPQVFAISKIVRACDRALRELNRTDVRLAAGSWRYDFVPASHRFFPPHIKLIGLDYDVLDDRSVLRDAESRKVLRDVGRDREVLPVIWAHHDDGNYLGRPYTPYDKFNARLSDAKACGYGIIHWTTRPLDLFFTSHARQVWASTQDEPLSETCKDTAARSFGARRGGALGRYLEHWVTEAPKFARETGTLFIDRPLTNVNEIVAGCRERHALLNSVDQSTLTPQQRDRVKYYLGLEEFMIAIHETQSALQSSQALLKAGNLGGARASITNCQPEEIIRQYARFSSLGGITRGEQGMVVALNLHWLVHYVQQRQALGLESIRCKFGPTSHEPLAQTPGLFTYYFDFAHQMWQTFGTKETGASTFELPARTKVTFKNGMPGEYAEICRSGIESDSPIEFSLRPLMGKGTLCAGDYQLRLLMLDPAATAAGQRVFTISIGPGADDSRREGPSPDHLKTSHPLTADDRTDIFQAAGAANRVLERKYPVAVGPSGAITIRLTPIKGKAILCAAVLEPSKAVQH